MVLFYTSVTRLKLYNWIQHGTKPRKVGFSGRIYLNIPGHIFVVIDYREIIMYNSVSLLAIAIIASHF